MQQLKVVDGSYPSEARLELRSPDQWLRIDYVESTESIVF